MGRGKHSLQPLDVVVLVSVVGCFALMGFGSPETTRMAKDIFLTLFGLYIGKKVGQGEVVSDDTAPPRTRKKRADDNIIRRVLVGACLVLMLLVMK